MEDNKKKKLSLVISLVTMLACCTVFTVLCAVGLIPIPTGNGKFYDMETAGAIRQSYEVEDEATLRKLLLLKEELDIVVTKDIHVEEPLIVKGTKTLYGDATISADTAGQFRTMYIMEVQVGASLTLDGPTLDGDGTVDGINVGQKAELTFHSGTIQYMRNGVYSNGTVNMDGGLVQHISGSGIIAAFRSKVYITGGTLYNSGSHLLEVETNGYAEVHDGALFKLCRNDALYNCGDLYVYGGEICDTIARAINTEGKLHMEYKGEKKDGYIEMHDIGAIAVRMTASDNCYISDVHGVNIGTNGVFTTDLRSNGKTTVENCIFENCAIVEGNGMSVSRKVTIKDCKIINSQGGGLNLRTYSDVKIDGLVIDGTKGNCISSYGELEMENVELSNVQVNNLVLYGESEATVKNCIFGQTKRTNVFMTKNTTLNLENVKVQGVKDEGIFAFQCNEGSTLNLLGDDNEITGATRVGICLYKNATLNMEGGKIYGINGTANGAAVWVREEGSTFNMSGGTICDNTTTGSSGAVFVADKAVFNMTGGTITGNSAKLSGGAVQVQGTMNFSGGTISNNTCGTTGGGINVGNNAKNEIYGTLNMTGGTISGNHAAANGGGISVSGKTTANISGGTIKDNTAEDIGNGIADNGYLTISKNANITGNDVGLISRDIILKIAGNSLNKHSASNPLVVTPHFKTKPNDYVVIECDSEAVAATMLNKYVKSGSNVYTLVQSTKQANQIVVNINDVALDMDTTGAETVYVTNFQELKEAVHTTKTKRNIVIGADIVMESLITVPTGTTVCIRDDGQTRTLTRNEGHATLFFETWYGTGLILEGTSEGKLVLDGTTSGDVTLKNVNSLMKVRGTTEVTNVAFQNNGNTTASIAGAFINNEYGHATIASCTFANGIAANGGAIYSTAEDMTITDCTFTNNNVKSRGGAIYNAKTVAVIENTTFTNNTAAGSGGAIHNASSGTLTLKGTNSDAVFKGNTVLGTLEKENYGGGALCVGTGNVTIEGYTFVDNTALNSNGGAIQFNSTNTTASVKNCTFETNSTDSNGGAIYSKAKATVEGTTFTGNDAAGGQGGAIISHGKVLTVTDCEFSENTAKGNGGAIYGGSNGTMTITTTDGSTFTGNTTSSNGGAICIGTGLLTVKGYEFIENEAVYGGAIRVNGDANVEAVIEDSVFTKNAAGYNGGAISNASKKTYEDETQAACTIANCEFSENTSAKHGGAIFHENSVMSVSDSTFTANSAITGNGGAMYPDAKSTLNIDVCKFDGNVAAGNGGAIYNAGGSTTVITGDSSDLAIFANNTAIAETTDRGGGAICIGSGTVSVSDYAFENNQGVKGGAIYSQGELEITDTSFTGNESTADGGAIYGKNGSLTMTNTNDSVFDGNTATGMGGAIYMDVGTISVTGYEFTNNTGTNGGAVRLAGSVETATFTECEFTSNIATDESSYGGAISNNSVSTVENAVTITDCKFEGNTAKYGAAIHNRQSELKLVGTKEVGAEDATAIFTGNTTTSSGQGGAIWVEGGNINIDKYAFDTNTSKDRGGAIWTKSGSTGTISNTVFTGNNAGGGGGAIHKEGTLTITDTDFISNTSTGAGGAINNEAGNATIQNCDFISNQSKSGNGGAVQAVGSGAVITIEVTDGEEHVFQNNTASNNGGAIRTNTAKLIVKGYKFDGNTATNSGGAVYADTAGSAVSFENATFVKNVATNGNGGAIYNANTKATDGLVVEDCTFGKDGDTAFAYANTAVKNGAYGGAIHTTSSANTKIVDSAFYYNKAHNGGALGSVSAGIIKVVADDNAGNAIFKGNACNNQGGAIRFYGCAEGTEISGYTFDSNTSKGNAGALQVDSSGKLEVKNSKFCNNSGTNGGAIHIAGNAKVKLTGSTAEGNISTFQGNTATGNGGALATGGSGTYEISNYVFKENGAANGGAIYSQIALQVSGSTFTGNTATTNGGAIWITNGKTATVTNSTFSNNTANDGGAIYLGEMIETKDEDGNVTETTYKTGTLKATGCTFTSNTGSNSYGGAIYVMKGSVEVKTSEFTSNYAKYQGGAIWVNSEVTATIEDSQFTGNTTGSKAGGAIWSAGELILARTQFANNIAGTGGGAINSEGGNITAEDCTFTSNQSQNGGNGGAIAAVGGAIVELKVSENGASAFTDNVSAGAGGAIHANNAKLSVTGVTFSGNSSAKDGGAINIGNGQNYKEADVNKFENVTFTNNTAGSAGGAVVCHGYALTVKNTNFSGNSAAANGGALYTGSSCIVTMTSDNGAKFENNFSGTVAEDGTVTTTGNGGAHCVGSGTVNVTGYTFDGNRASQGGAVKFNNAAITATYADCTFTRNEATENGGAIYNQSNSTAENAITFTSCAFGGAGTESDAYALGNKAVRGGAIYNVASQLKLDADTTKYTTAALFQGNKATDNGGAIYMNAGKLDVSGYSFTSNNAKNYGGAIAHTDDKNAVEMDILNCTFASNSTNVNHGGAIYHYKKDIIEITGTNFNGNSANGHGGAICSEGGTLTVANCDFTNNTAGNQGGAYRLAASANATFENGTFSGNSAVSGGGAIQFNTGILVITNYVFTGNTVNGSSNSINTNNKGSSTNYTQLVGCTIESSDISGKGVK